MRTRPGTTVRRLRPALLAALALLPGLMATPAGDGFGASPARADATWKLSVSPASAASAASAVSAVSAVSSVSKQGTDRAAGSTAVSGGPAGSANPGDVIDWTLKYKNLTGSPADVAVDDPITSGQSLVPGSLRQPPGWNVAATTSWVSGTASAVLPSGSAGLTFTPGEDTSRQPSSGERFNVFPDRSRRWPVGSVTATPGDAYCDGQSHPIAWQGITVAGLPDSKLERSGQLAVTVRDAAGNVVTDSTGAMWSNRLLPSATHLVDLSHIGYGPAWNNGRGGTFDTTELTAQVALISSRAADNPARAMRLTWNSDGEYQICYQTKIDEQCAAFTVADDANFLTTAVAGGLTDAPAGTSSGSASFDVNPSPDRCGLTVATASSSPAVLAGQPIVFTTTITNTGTIPWTGSAPAAVDDDLAGLLPVAAYNNDAATSAGSVSYAVPTLSWSGALEPGATATVTYSVTTSPTAEPGSIAENSVRNLAGVPGNCSAETPCSASVPVQTPGITVAKSADVTGVQAVGDQVNFQYTVTNTGTAPLNSVTVTDAIPVACPLTELPPGTSMDCASAAAYAVNAQDIEAGSLGGTVTATGTPLGGSPVSATANLTLPVLPSPAAENAGSPDASGVRNPGGALQPATVADPAAGAVPNADASGHAAPPTETAPAASVLSPALVAPVASERDLDKPASVLDAGVGTPAGRSDDIRNFGNAPATGRTATSPVGRSGKTAVTKGTSPTGSLVTTAPSKASGRIMPDPSLTMAEDATPATPETPVMPTTPAVRPVRPTGIDAGAVANTTAAQGTPSPGPQPGSPLSNAFVTASQAAAMAATKWASPNAVPAAGRTAGYPVPVDVSGIMAMTTAMQTDLYAEAIANTARVTATLPSVEQLVLRAQALAGITQPAVEAPTLRKSVSPSTVSAAGELLTYTFQVANPGHTTLTGVGITVTAFSGTGAAPVASCAATMLAPGASTQCSATYTVTQADINAGGVTNTALAHGTPQSGRQQRSLPSSVTVTVCPMTASRIATPILSLEPTPILSVEPVLSPEPTPVLSPIPPPEPSPEDPREDPAEPLLSAQPDSPEPPRHMLAETGAQVAYPLGAAAVLTALGLLLAWVGWTGRRPDRRAD